MDLVEHLPLLVDLGLTHVTEQDLTVFLAHTLRRLAPHASDFPPLFTVADAIEGAHADIPGMAPFMELVRQDLTDGQVGTRLALACTGLALINCWVTSERRPVHPHGRRERWEGSSKGRCILWSSC
jgi:hypothetical protein